MNQLLVSKEFRNTIENSKYFPQIKDYFGEKTETLLKGLQRIKNKSKSKNFKHWQYLQCFGNFIQYLQENQCSFDEFKKLAFDDRNLIYGNFIMALEQGKITQEIGRNKGKSYAISSIRNVFQSRIQACLRILDFRIEQPKKSVIKGVTKYHKNKIALTKELNKQIYDRIHSKGMKLLFIFHLNSGLRFSDLLKEYKIHSENGYWYLKDVKTAKEEVYIPFIPLSKEFKNLTLEYFGKKPQTTKELFKSKSNKNTDITMQAYNLRLQNIVKELIELGIIEENTTISSHSIRKYFYNCWLQTKDVQLAEFMMGHSSGIALGIIYSQYQIFEKYKQIEELFLVNTSIIDKTSEEVKEFKEKLKEKDSQIAKLNEKLTEIMIGHKNSKDIDRLLLEAFQLTLKDRNQPMRYTEKSNQQDIPISQSKTSQKLQEILKKLSKLVQ